MNSFSMTASYDVEKLDHGTESAVETNYVKGALFLLFILALVALLVRVIINPGTFPIRTVRIEGEFRHLSPKTLKAAVTDVVRGGFFDVNVETIQKTLMDNPWVNGVTVRRAWPDGIKVQVTERVAVARWKDRGLLSREAVFFSPAPESWPGDLPMFSGPDNTYRLLLARYGLINSVLRNTGLNVTNLNLNERGAFDFSLSNGITVIVGRNEIENRINKFEEYAWPTLKKDTENIISIDMRYTNGFVVTWKNVAEEIVEMRQENHG